MTDPSDFGSGPYPAPDMADVQLVDILRALAEPIRLQILRQLADGEPHAKREKGWDFGVQKSTMAHHYRTLRETGVTLTIVEGRNHVIQLRRAELDLKFPGLIAALIAAPASELPRA